MKRVHAILLLIALTYWLVPTPVVAQEKYEFNYIEPEEWAMDRSWVTPEQSQQLYEEWLDRKKKVSKPLSTSLNGFNPCSCVSYARHRSRINVGPVGVARNHPVNSKSPAVGAILITYESRAGHASYVVSFDDKFVYVDEANYSKCKVTLHRAIPLNSKLIKGYYRG